VGENVTHPPQSVTNSLEETPLQGVRYGFPLPRYGFARYRYRRVDGGKSGVVHVRTDIADPRAHVAAIVGPCDRWEEGGLSSDEPLNEPTTPLSLMVARGAVFQDWAGIGQACADLFSDAADKAAAAKQWFYRHPEVRDDLRRVAEGEEPLAFTSYRYRRAGDRKTAIVHVRADIATPLAHVEAIIGPCDRDQWRPVAAPSPANAASPPLPCPAAAPPAAPSDAIPQSEPGEYEDDLEQFEPGAYEQDFEELLAQHGGEPGALVEARMYSLRGPQQLRLPWSNLSDIHSPNIDR
jgi:hypothetical protein